MGVGELLGEALRDGGELRLPSFDGLAVAKAGDGTVVVGRAILNFGYGRGEDPDTGPGGKLLYGWQGAEDGVGLVIKDHLLSDGGLWGAIVASGEIRGYHCDRGFVGRREAAAGGHGIDAESAEEIGGGEG